jgi:hypothetical protein
MVSKGELVSAAMEGNDPSAQITRSKDVASEEL